MTKKGGRWNDGRRGYLGDIIGIGMTRKGGTGMTKKGGTGTTGGGLLG